MKRPKTHHTLSWWHYRLELGPRTAVMGIVNITPDSFSDGGRFFSTGAAVTQALQLAADGADIVDIGGESTRPFAHAVSGKEEIQRVIPVIEKLAKCINIPISIDTTKAEVAEAAINAGASIINDVSALRFDPQMSQIAVRYDVPVVLMHMLGEPRTMQIKPSYTDVAGEVSTFLQTALQHAGKAGIDRCRLIVDPGIGFGKNIRHNLLLIQQIEVLTDLGVPVLIGPSRKAFIRKILTPPSGTEPAPDSPEVETGTQAAVAAAVMNGAHIVRVHDVARTKAMLTVLDAICEA